MAFGSTFLILQRHKIPEWHEFDIFQKESIRLIGRFKRFSEIALELWKFLLIQIRFDI